MRRIEKRRAHVAPAAPAAPPRERFVPPWATRIHSWAQSCQMRAQTLIREIGEGDYRIPRFQRPWKWTDGQILALLDSLQNGYRTGAMLFWDRYGLKPSVEHFGGLEVLSNGSRAGLVIDGQQRMGALYAAAHSGRFWFDLQTGKFTVGEAGAWMMPALMVIDRGFVEYFDWAREHIAAHGMERDGLDDRYIAAVGTMEHAEMSAIVLPHDWARDRIVETYRRINREGTPVTPDELEAALATTEDE